MTRLRKTLYFVLFLSLISSLAPVWAAGESTAGDYFGGMGRQIGRGLWNVVSSPAEIPCTTSAEMKEGGAGFFPGVGKGFAYFLRRALVGVVEVGTFIMPAEATIPPVCAAPQT